MSYAVLLIFTAIAGFIFCEYCYPYKILLPRLNGQAFYIRALTFGIPFLVTSFLVSKFAFYLPTKFPATHLFTVADDENLFSIGIFAIVLGYITSKVVNYLFNHERFKDKRKQWIKDAMGKNDFDSIIYQSANKVSLITITLDSRKVYVGITFDGLDPKPNNSHLTLLPIFSGYRDSETLNLHITIKYQQIGGIIKALIKENNTEERHKLAMSFKHYMITFPRDKIVNMHFFNDSLYKDAKEQITPTTTDAQEIQDPPLVPEITE